MPGPFLTTASQIACPHGGQAILSTSQSSVRAGALVLLESDVHSVAGCPFTVGNKYSPCVTIEWSGGAGKTSVGGTAALISSSVGQCKNGEGAVQGTAIVSDTQQEARAV